LPEFSLRPILPFLPFLLAPALLLAGCQTSPEVASRSRNAVASAEPLVAQCQAEFTRSLGEIKVTPLGGPSVTNFGDAIGIRLEAQPVDPNIIDAKIYSCDFEQGVMIHHGPA
jgi:hypothetical protein